MQGQFKFSDSALRCLGNGNDEVSCTCCTVSSGEMCISSASPHSYVDMKMLEVSLFCGHRVEGLCVSDHLSYHGYHFKSKDDHRPLTYRNMKNSTYCRLDHMT